MKILERLLLDREIFFTLARFLAAVIILSSGMAVLLKRRGLKSGWTFFIAASALAGWSVFGYPLFPRVNFPGVCFFILAAVSITLLYFRIWSKSSLGRQRARIMLLAVLCVMPAVAAVHYFNLNPQLIFLLLAGLSLLSAYVLLHCDLFGVDNFIRRTIGYLVIIGLVAGAFWFFVSLSASLKVPLYRHPAFLIFFILFFSLSFDAVCQLVDRLVNRFLLGSKVDFQKLIARISDDLTILLELDRIVSLLKSELVKVLRLLRAEILILHYKENDYRDQTGSISLSPEHELFKLIEKKGGEPVSSYELSEDPAYQKISPAALEKMRELKASVIVPMIFKAQTVGLLVLGERKTGVLSYNLDELGYIKNAGFQAAIAIENAKLYENLDDRMKEIKMMQSGLEKKIEQRTEEVKEKNKELDRLNNMLKDATLRKSRFLANMSREIRVPLTSVMGFSDLICSGVYGKIPQKAKEAVTEMQRSEIHLLGLLNDILDLQNVESGRIDLKMTEFSLKDALGFVRFATQSLLGSKKLYLKIRVGWGLRTAFGDEKRLRQVLINLIGNSAKFTSRGGVTLRVKKSGDSLLFEEEDSGVGIPKEKIGEVFKEFKQLHSAAYGGTGLGLAISKKLIELQGGKIWVESRVGRGTKFSFLIPLKK